MFNVDNSILDDFFNEEDLDSNTESNETENDLPSDQKIVEDESESDEMSSNEDVSEKVSKQEEPVDETSTKKEFVFPCLIGKKIGMTQLYADDGSVFPTTVVQAGPCTVTQIKTSDIDGYDAIQIGYLDKKEKNTTKSLLGHFKRSSCSPKKILKEFRIENKIENLKEGNMVSVNQFDTGDLITVSGFSKGKGFAGHMKRHGFGGGRASHGKNSVMRKSGSVGAGTSPGKVWKGTRMAGRMGNDKVTVKNLEIIKMDSEKNLLFVSGSVPGSNNNLLCISKVD